MTSLAAVTGRFQPFHVEHLELVQLALAECDHVVVGITNPDQSSRQAHPESTHRHLDEANPFTFWQRLNMIAGVFAAENISERTTIVPFPLHQPQLWAEYIPLSAVQYVRVLSPWEQSKVTELEAGGYRVRVIAGHRASPVRASDIRRALRGSSDIEWRNMVPHTVAGVLDR